MPQVRVSCATEDAAIARKVADAVRAAGVGVWIAPGSIKPEERYNKATAAKLRACGSLAVRVSRASDASKHVVREVVRRRAGELHRSYTDRSDRTF